MEQMEQTEQVDIRRFLNEEGKIVQLPGKQRLRRAVMSYLAEKFEHNKDYTEQEVNAVCAQWHTFGDYFMLRRELIDNKLLLREKDGSRYWKPEKE